MKFRTFTITASAMGMLAVGLGAPALAKPSGLSLSVHDGIVGVSQTVSATVNDIGLGGGYGTLTFTAGGQNLGTASVGLDTGETGSVSWTPGAAGSNVNVSVTFTSTDGSSTLSDSTNVRIAMVNTQASVSSPDSATTSSAITLAATVRAQTGSYVPTGSVTFYTGDGTAIGSSNLDGNGRAQISYTTPGSPGTVFIYVIYNGDASANASKKSSADSIKIVQGTPTVSLVAPQTNYIGSPVQLTAKVNPPSGTGTVAFTANGSKLGTVNVANGVATITWTPSTKGKVTLKATYSGGNGVGGSTASNDVMVNASLKPDQITVNPAGSTGPWPDGSTQGLANGAQVQLNASSASGAPVTLAASTPCSMSGNVLSVNGVGAPCTVTATTQGGNGFAPGNATFTVVQGLGTQTATVNPAPSGSYAKGKKLQLAPATALTNLGNRIAWSVVSGKKSCKIIRPGGAVKVSLVKSGSCRVQGSAPSVPGQWTAYTITRDYTVK